jgi:peptidoglycan/LPS O-acetylase OafA/YrhL
MTAPPSKSADSRRNSFDLVRLLAAAAVVVNHSLVLNGHRGILVFEWHDRALDLGGFAVVVFFVVSGNLVAGSWIAEPDVTAFFAKRALRVFPGLTVVVLLSVLVLGPVVTSVPLGEYFTSRTTWNYVGTISLTPIRILLPGVFTGNPVPYVNGSLWTLPGEMICYCILAVLAFFGAVRRRWPLLLALVLVTATRESHLGGTSVDMGLAGLVMFFLLGALLRVYPIPVSRTGAALAVGSLIVSLWSGVFVVGAPGLAYLVIFAASRPTRLASALGRFGDPSYGIYIYAYPLQQTLVLVGLARPWALLVTSLPLAIALGYCSWHFVERPVMSAGRSALRHRRATRVEQGRHGVAVGGPKLWENLGRVALPSTSITRSVCASEVAQRSE